MRDPGASDLGPPVAYPALREGTPVYDRNGEPVGVVDRVLVDEVVDIFEGLIIHTRPLPGRHLLADANQVGAMHERGVLLTVGRGELHQPAGGTGRTRAGNGRRPADGMLAARLRHAWDRLAGRT